MSSGYRSRGGDNYNRGRGGGGFGKPRRYWDSDDYYENNRDKRRRYSRSRSRSRSYSRSPSPRNNARRISNSEYGAPPPVPPTPSLGGQAYDPYVAAAEPSGIMKPMENISNNGGWTAVGVGGGGYHANGGGVDKMAIYNQYQNDPSVNFGGYENVQPVQQQEVPVTSSSSKKNKKKDKKKKKSRKRSSSSSSSSSDSSSGSRRKNKKKGSDDSSDSDDDDGGKTRKEKEKEKPTSEAVGSKLTDEQRQALLTQEEGYKQKQQMLEREILKLQTKEEELKRGRGDSRLIEENQQLQVELRARYQAVRVVLEKINNVLLADKLAAEKPAAPPPPKISKKYESETKVARKEVMDVDYVDNGEHWCRLCNVFPESIEAMLKHFHSKGHCDQVEQLGIDDKPWHKRNSVVDKPPTASTNRKLPYRGMQFFTPVEGWYCRLCNSWMGDEHCATIHLKSVEHNSNYMTFLEEHPGWETKWAADRENARGRAAVGHAKSYKTEIIDNDENSRSIRVQMRNTIKIENSANQFMNKNADKEKDSNLDEWMSRPQKVPVDIDTQKFAEIVKQRHGSNKKDEDPKNDRSQEKRPSRFTPQKDEGRERGEIDRRRHDKVELQFSSREKERDRDRDRGDRFGGRDVRGGRRRSPRSRSRSRERDRGFHSRRRSRSHSRERDRRDRDRNSRPSEPVKKQMPMIGKMPLFKRAKIETKPETNVLSSSAPSDNIGSASALTEEQVATSLAQYDENSAASYGDAYSTYVESEQTAYVGAQEMISSADVSAMHHSSVDTTALPVSMVPPPVVDDLKPPGEKEAPGGTNLPDDLQHALDIIYKGGGKPITVPPPNYPLPIPPASAAYDYSGGFPTNFMGYEPYQMSFDGYTPADMEEVPSLAANNTSTPSGNTSEPEKSKDCSTAPKSSTQDEEEGGDDDDDLAMLGIDMDDTAVVRK